MTAFCVATLETRNFTFEGVGVTRDSSIRALTRACQAHCKATGAAWAYFADLLREDAGNYSVKLFQPGWGYRDGSAITKPDGSTCRSIESEVAP